MTKTITEKIRRYARESFALTESREYYLEWMRYVLDLFSNEEYLIERSKELMEDIEWSKVDKLKFMLWGRSARINLAATYLKELIMASAEKQWKKTYTSE